MQLGELTIGKVKDILCEQIDTYAKAMNDAFRNQSGALDVGLTLKFRQIVDTKVELAYGINFVSERVREGDKMVIDDAQQELPFDAR